MNYSFEIPTGYVVTSSERLDDLIIHKLELDIKVGDWVVIAEKYTGIYNGDTTFFLILDAEIVRNFGINPFEKIRKASKFEIQHAIDFLLLKQLKWNGERLIQIEERAKKGGKYYFVNPFCKVAEGTDNRLDFENKLYETCNYRLNKSSCLMLAIKFKKMLNQIK